jgi:hypothetical protein
MTTIQYVMAIALSLFVFVALANVVVDLYARGVVRAAVDEAARAGAAVDTSPVDCEQRARDVLANLLAGDAGRSVRVSCREIGGTMEARAQVTLAAWIPGVPSWSFAIADSVVKERTP